MQVIQPSNMVLLEKITNVDNQVCEVKTHLKTLNGTVADNQKKIILVKNVYTVLFPILTLIIGFLANALIK